MFASLILRLALPFIISVSISSGSYGTPTNSTSIGIYNAKELALIGNDSRYPSDGDYQIMSGFNANDFATPIRHFTGSIDGNNNTICHLTNCLFDTLTGSSIVKNLVILNANINNAKCGSAIARVMQNNATVADIIIAHSNFNNIYNNTSIGMVVGTMTSTSVVHDIDIAYSQITTSGSWLRIAGVAGHMKEESKIMDIIIFGSTLIATGPEPDIGIVAGLMSGNSIVKDIIAIKTSIETKEDCSDAGICAGAMTGNSDCSNIASIDVSIIVPGKSDSVTGWGAGDMSHNSTINNTITINGYITIFAGPENKDITSMSRAGAGAGYMSQLTKNTNIIAINSKIYIPFTDDFYLCSGGNGHCSIEDTFETNSRVKENNSRCHIYDTRNTTNKCLFVKHAFITDDCKTNNKSFVYFEKYATMNIYCKSATDTKNNTVIIASSIIGGVAIVGLTVAIIVYYRFWKKLYGNAVLVPKGEAPYELM